MVLVCLGTQDLPFHRLLTMVEQCVHEGVIQEDVIAQIGYTKYPKNNHENGHEENGIQTFDFCPAQEMEGYIAQANYVITHAGTGTIVTALKQGKKVIAVNRLKKFGEHTDDHQMEIIQEFASTGYLLPCYEDDDLKDKINQLKDFVVPPFQSNTNAILAFLRGYIDGVVR